MKKYQYITSLLLAGSSLFMSGCQDDFAELNQDPSTVTQANVSYLFSQGILEFEPSQYQYWFYSGPQMFQWIQSYVPNGGVSSDIFEGGTKPDLKAIDVLKYLNEIKYVRSKMAPEEGEKYALYEAAMNVLAVYMGIYDSDFIGDIPYTEAAQALHGGTLTPKFDRVADLYPLWLSTLDESVKILTTTTGQSINAKQDAVYGGKVEKWAKLANSLKLKIAARLISQDRAKALKIAEQVASASCGVLNGAEDDFLFNKATYNSKDANYTYHWNDGVMQAHSGSKSLIDMMVENRDPRVRFIFRKNDWNSKVVQLFIAAGKKDQIPHYIMNNVELDAQGNFKEWKAPGEPWVRYYGLPEDFDANKNNAVFGDWYDWGIRCKFDDKHTYMPFSMFQEEQIRGRKDFGYPICPDDPVIEDKVDNPWYGMYMTTGEVNLYLAEFKLLGANIPGQAKDYFNKAIKASVEEYDRLASLNKIPYYGTTYDYDVHEKAIDLVDGEVADMMSHADYQLTGDKATDLEKVYIQQLVHFSLSPIDCYVTARRSGVPTLNSKIWQRKDYAANGLGTNKVPRRMAMSAPSPTDLLFEILSQSYKDQGYTIGSGDILNSERVWQDKNAPQWGAGPKF